MFERFKTRKKDVQTPIGPGASETNSDYGEFFTVQRYHRGVLLQFSWPASTPQADKIPTTVANIQLYLDRALDMIDASEQIRAAVIQHGGVYPDGADWFSDGCDFTLSFGYFGWEDGTLSFEFRNGQIINTHVGD